MVEEELIIKWTAETEKEELFIKIKKHIPEKGCYTMLQHCDSHRSSFLQRMGRTKHVPYQELPNEQTQIWYLLEAIKCTDSFLMARIANTNCNWQLDGKQYIFEKAIEMLISVWSVGILQS